MPRTFYRLVKSDPPTPADFLSHYARGWEPRKKDPVTLDRWRGVSVYETEEQAKNAEYSQDLFVFGMAKIERPLGDLKQVKELVLEVNGPASAVAQKFPQLGRHIAMLEIPEGGPIRLQRTGREEGHHTLWAEPVDLLARVVSVVSV